MKNLPILKSQRSALDSPYPSGTLLAGVVLFTCPRLLGNLWASEPWALPRLTSNTSCEDAFTCGAHTRTSSMGAGRCGAVRRHSRTRMRLGKVAGHGAVQLPGLH